VYFIIPQHSGSWLVFCILLQPYSCWFVLTHLIINEVGLILCIIFPHPVNFFQCDTILLCSHIKTFFDVLNLCSYCTHWFTWVENQMHLNMKCACHVIRLTQHSCTDPQHLLSGISSFVIISKVITVMVIWLLFSSNHSWNLHFYRKKVKHVSLKKKCYLFSFVL